MRRPSFRPADDVGRRLRRVTLGFVGVGLGVAALLLRLVIAASVARQSRAAVEAAREAATALDHELALREHAVEAIVVNAEQILDGRVVPTVEVATHLRPVPERGGFVLTMPAGVEGAETCSLMGEGPVPAAGSEAAAEMRMAVALTPSLHVLQRRGPEIPWAYFVSRRGFLYLCPRVPDGTFLWSHELLLRYERTPPGGAQLRVEGPRRGWSLLYEDEAGKGPMTTLSELVVHDGRRVGDVSVDVSAAMLVARLRGAAVAGASVHLLAPDGSDMLHGAPMPERLGTGVPRTGLARLGPADVAVAAMSSTGWRVAVVTPRRAKYLRALRESSAYGLAALFIVASMALLASLAKALRAVHALSVRDALTGVFNRRHFDDCLRYEVARAHRGGLKLGLAILDVDHFKRFNDCYGHHAGDEALRVVARALGSSLQRGGDLLFRVGGEEFAVLACIERDEQLHMLGDKLRAAVRAVDLAHAGSPMGRVTISVGATAIDAASRADVDAVYQQADAALYRAKQAGRDRVVVG